MTNSIGFGIHQTVAHVKLESAANVTQDLLSFFADRLKVYLRDQGARHDLIDAVFALEGQDDLLMIVRRVEALGRFLDTEDGKNLLAGYRRAANILRIEEKKDGRAYSEAPDLQIVNDQGQIEEKALAVVLAKAKEEARIAVEIGGFRGRDARPVAPAPACRRLLRQGDRECGGSRASGEPPAAPQRPPRGDAHGGGFLPHRGVMARGGLRHAHGAALEG